MNKISASQKSAIRSKKVHFDQTKVISALLEDATTDQQNLMNTLVSALLLAIRIGHSLLKIKALIPHGQTQKFIVDHFCKPNNVSLRTAERYQSIARNSEALLAALRSGNPELESKTDDEILSQLSINDAYTLVKKLAKIEDGQVQSQLTLATKPDANGWVTPSWLMAIVTEFLGHHIDIDPSPIESRAELITSDAAPLAIEAMGSQAPWKDRVWISPGLHKVDHAALVKRLIAEVESGTVKEGLILVPATMNSKHAELLRVYPLAFMAKPLEVSGPQLTKTRNKTALMIAYVGPKHRYIDFAKAFSKNDSFVVFLPAAPILSQP